MILPNFPKNCMKLRNFWAVKWGAQRSLPHLDPPMPSVVDPTFIGVPPESVLLCILALLFGSTCRNSGAGNIKISVTAVIVFLHYFCRTWE